MIRVFIGFDKNEVVAYNVLQHSINARSTAPVAITPINLRHLNGIMTRERNPLQSTEFSFSRFLVPYLAGYQGWAIFMDCDMLVLDDIAKLWALRDDRYAVMCVKHVHVPPTNIKFLAQPQTQYEKKNWSSVMLMNCAKCTALTPDYVNTASGLDLHRFRWLESENLIGELPLRWNYLVDYYKTIDTYDISNLHYTEGGPYFEAYKDCSYAKEWAQEREEMGFCQQKPV